MKKFHADLVIADTEQTLLKKGNILRIGGAARSDSVEKHCYPDECSFSGRSEECPLKRAAHFCA